MANHVFCRDLALERDEPLAGTGALAKRMILLRWPRGDWRVPRQDSVGMGEALRVAVEAAIDAGLQVVLVDRPEEFDRLPQIQADGVAADCGCQDELAEVVARLAKGEILQGRGDERTTILCCTDSRRDACCARYGFATFKALMAEADPARFNVLQATHLGGCRFAASLVVLPQRQRYARLAPEEAPAFLAALEQGQLYLPAFRGRADLPEVAQVAELAALNWANDRGIAQSQVQLKSANWPGETYRDREFVAMADAGGTALSVRTRLDIVPVSGRCESAPAAPVSTPRWRLVSVSPQ